MDKTRDGTDPTLPGFHPGYGTTAPGPPPPQPRAPRLRGAQPPPRAARRANRTGEAAAPKCGAPVRRDARSRSGASREQRAALRRRLGGRRDIGAACTYKSPSNVRFRGNRTFGRHRRTSESNPKRTCSSANSEEFRTGPRTCRQTPDHTGCHRGCAVGSSAGEKEHDRRTAVCALPGRHGMRRREFIGMLGGAAAWPFAAQAQQPDRMRRIGVLMNRVADDPEGQARFKGIRARTQQSGWTNGRNVGIDVRWTAGVADNVRKYAAELVALMPDVILADGAVGMAPLQHATRTVPIVFVTVPDPGGTVSSKAWRSRAATLLDLPRSNTPSRGNGLNCSRRSRQA